MFTDDDRRSLYNALEHSLGPGPAAILMAHLPPVGWAELATGADVAALRGELKAETGALRGELAELRGELSELRGQFAELRGEVRGLVPKLVAANVATMVGVAGLVLGAVAVG